MVLERVIRGLQGRAHDPTDFWFNPIGATVPNDAGVIVTAATSIRLTTVYACVRVIAEALASLPLPIYERQDKGKRRATDHRYWPSFASTPNEAMSKFTWIELMLVHLTLWGNHYSQIERPGGLRGGGSGLRLTPLKPWTVRPRRDEVNGRIFYEVTDEQTAETRIVRADEMVHIPGLGFDGVLGFPVLSSAGEAIGIGLAAQQFAGRFFGSGMRPSGIFTYPGKFTTPARKRWKQWLIDNFGGSHRSHNAMVLEEGMSFTPMSMRPDEAQFLESRKYQAIDVARAFRVPPYLIYEMEQATPKRSVEQQAIDFVIHTLRPWAVRIEAELNRKVWLATEGNKFFVEFLFDALLRGDFKTRMEGYNKGRQIGLYTINEVRRLENMIEIGPEGDVYMVQANMINAGQLLQVAPAEEDEDDLRMARALEAFVPMFSEARMRLASSERSERRNGERVTADKLEAWTDKFWLNHRRFAESVFDPRIQGVARLMDGQASPDFVNVFCNQYVQGRREREADSAEEQFDELGRRDVVRVGRWVTCARITESLAAIGDHERN